MQLITVKDYSELSRKAANIIAAQILLKPDCLLGLATGSSPLGIYKCLIQKYQNQELDFSGVSTVNLDEYVGLSDDNPQSYHYFMKTNIFDHINIRPENCYIPSGTRTDSDAACHSMDHFIKASGGVDLQLLGLGENGHIGFNEPGPCFEKENRIVALTESTIAANSRFFSSADEVPTSAYTMGIRTIMQARKILIVVSGQKKAQIAAKAFFGPVTPEVPASILQLHTDVTLVADEAALAHMPRQL